MRLARLAPALALLPLAAAPACGDDANSASKLTGLYKVTSYTEVSGDCTGTPAPVTDTTHLFVKSADFLGVKTLQVIGCDSADGCGSDPEAFPEFTFLQRSGSGWFTTASSASPGGGQCSLGFSEQRLTPTATGIHIENTFSSKVYELSEAACTTDAAESKKGELVCNSKTVVDADAL
ncbi:MAG: hypothetical protein U1F43_14935 [Myxococcota bacterium]